MHNEINKDDFELMIDSLERLTQEYKSLLFSREYRLGKKVIEYLYLLKRGKVTSIIKRLFNRNSKAYNQIISENIQRAKGSIWTDNKIAVYTSIFGDYDILIEPIIKPNNIDYYIITDQNVPADSVWKKIDLSILPKELKTNTEKNRYVKMHPHYIFKEYEYSIYIDGNVMVTSDLTPMISSLEDFPIAMHKHKNRNCVYEEIEACLNKGKGKKEDLLAHQDLLKQHGVPAHGGLLEATIIARKHHSKVCVNLMDMWWQEFVNYSKRDQISLIDVLWQEKISLGDISKLGENTFSNDMFVIVPHK